MTTEATYYLKPDGEIALKIDGVSTWTRDATWLMLDTDNIIIAVITNSNLGEGYSKTYVKYFVPEGTDTNQYSIASLPINSEIIKESELPDLFRMSVLCGVI